MRGCLRRVSIVGLSGFLLLLALGVLTHPGRIALKSAGLLVEVFPSAPVRPLRWFTDAPERTEVRYAVADGETVADLYRPGDDGRRGAMIFYIGVGQQRGNPHVVRVAEGLARTGIVVMVPVSKELSELRVTARETEGVVAAFEYLRSQPYVDPARIGILGISAGGSLVAIAASNPRISDQVRLLELFGSYYSANDMISAIILRQIEVDGERREWQPSPASTDVFLNILPSSVSASDRPALVALFERKTTSIPAGLSPDSRAIAELLANRDPERMPALLGGLPEESRQYLASISPESYVEDLHAELFLLHDRGDKVIPFTESRRFYGGARNVRDKHLVEFQLFQHVAPTSNRNPFALAREASKLYRHLYAVLSRLT